MDLVLQMETRNYNKIREKLMKDDTTSRSSMTFKEGKEYGVEGYILYVSGTEEQVKKALELSKDMAKEISDKKKDEIIAKIKEEENRASEAMGGLFG
jgi:hypothetical protein